MAEYTTDRELIEKYLNAPMPNLNWARRQAMRAQAYYDLCPYPVFNFSEWKTELRGPLPKCLPFCSNIVKQSAKWLFGKPPRITCDNEKADQYIIKPFQKLYPKLIQAITTSLIEGSISLRFVFDSVTKETHFSFLSTLDNVRYVYDAHDQDKVLVAYVQYPYYDPDAKKWFMYREAWTDNTFCTFEPVAIAFQPVRFGQDLVYGNVAFVLNTNTHSGNDSYQTVETFEGWAIDKIDANPLGFIPLIQIRDTEGDSVYGEGILWRATQAIDRINLSYHLMDRSNQYDSDPSLFIIDADLATLDVGNLAPGGSTTLNTKEAVDGANRQAQVKLIEPSGRLRPYMAEYTSDLRQQVSDLTGTVELATKDISNKGNLTTSVLNLLFAPIIASTNARRSIWEAKLEEFFAKCAVSTNKLLQLGWSDKNSFNLQWADYFIMPEQEKVMLLDRLVKQEGLGLMTQDRIKRTMASTDGIEDVEKFLEELAEYDPEYADLIKDPNATASGIGDDELAPSDQKEKDEALSRNQAKPKSKQDDIL